MSGPFEVVGSLSDVLAGVSANLGVGSSSLSLPQASSYVLVLVDGLSCYEAAKLGFSVDFSASALCTTIPSTTATALTSLATGLGPGQHGVVGYTFAYPQSPDLVSALRLPNHVSPFDVQPRATLFERLGAASISSAVVAPALFRSSGFTEASLRGASFWSIADESDVDEFVGQVVSANAENRVVYAYYRGLDKAGHASGVDSEDWRAELAWVDQTLGELRRALPRDVVLLVTGDHGMINVERKVFVDDYPTLCSGVRAFGGEGRFAHLYTHDVEGVAGRWQDFFGSNALIMSRSEAIALNWFGPVSSQVVNRIGDVLVAMLGPIAAIPACRPAERTIVGMHGSVMDAETRVPLFVG